jgi:choline transport protein
VLEFELSLTCAIMSKKPGDAVLEDSLGNGDVLHDADLVTSEKRGTEFDTRDMNRMGKLPQLRVGLLFAL